MAKFVLLREEVGIAVYEHKPGYIETVTSNRAALISILFIGVVSAFTLLLIRIAGKRWTAEGRYARLDHDDTRRHPEAVR
jgi:hypothetical protein